MSENFGMKQEMSNVFGESQKTKTPVERRKHGLSYYPWYNSLSVKYIGDVLFKVIGLQGGRMTTDRDNAINEKFFDAR